MNEVIKEKVDYREREREIYACVCKHISRDLGEIECSGWLSDSPDREK